MGMAIKKDLDGVDDKEDGRVQGADLFVLGGAALV